MRHRRLAVVVLSGSVVMLPLAARAALPIFNGPGSNDPSNRYTAPSQTAKSVNNTGTAVVAMDEQSQGTTVDERVFRWSPGVAATKIDLVGGFDGVTAINAPGTIIGNADYFKPFKVSPGSTTPVLLTLPPRPANALQQAVVYDINDVGAIVGNSDVFSGSTSIGIAGLRWLPGATTPQILAPLDYGSNGKGVATAFAVSENLGSIAVGTSARHDPSTHADLGMRAVRWANTTPVELEPISTRPDGYASSYVTDINRAGLVVGASDRYTGSTYEGSHAARWAADSALVIELGALPTYPGSGHDSHAQSINDANVAVGWQESYFLSKDYPSVLAIRWDKNGLATQLNNLPVYDDGTQESATREAYAFAVNNVGAAVGNCQNPFITDPSGLSPSRAVVWLPGTDVALDLNTLKRNIITPGATQFLRLQYANAISETGFITGTGAYDFGIVSPGGGTGSRAFTMLVPQAGTYGWGDANFDTKVDFADLLILARNYNTTNGSVTNATQSIYVGDFDLNGKVEFADLLALAKHYGYGTDTGPINNASDDVVVGNTSFAADWSLAQSLVPEPGLFGAIGLFTLGAMRVRQGTRR